ncbi:disease resistance protein RPV1 isoform X2 [Vitis vinifera]|uniref:disease resistance protein RPV1 isoform X2 n=1 Tax=Vitis vinifera TaxID=29760 RepID=UPI00053FDB1A|nr:disease resistance protein RPV1 isoform X2 [Vitis vinifera]|eukprot:XP_019079004.1 PREDICTED: TMV resistance protein N isoform X2 [Vitis vinifera]
MASSSTSLSVASSSSTHPWKYEVFLSFRGEDTRKSFTDHLHKALRRCGIHAFIDDRLRRGEQISSALLRAIEESRFSIIIFSEHYASSSWCLDELTKILQCVKEGRHTAFPVFYNVDPSHVRKQEGSYGVAFTKHEQVYRDNMEKVVEWRKALTVASNLSGWDSRDKHESEVIKEIVSKIWKKLNDASSCNMEALVGMASHIQNMVSLLRIGSDDVRMVGIWGMAGIGKTTIAEAVYQKIRTRFEGCCFLSNVREKSQKNDPAVIQMELLSQIFEEGNLNTGVLSGGINVIEKTLHSMRVLIVLDDVDCPQQLEVLAGNHNWFSPGSRIIITTREKHLLDEKVEIYVAKELNKDEARKLFYQHAFKYKPPVGDFVQLCDRALNYTKGIPLALKILGRFLYNRSKKEWESELEKLRRIPNKEIQDVLRISFDGLDDNQKDIFLDIACFFKGQDKDYVIKLLKSCDFFPEIEIRNLIDKSLVTISYNKLCMHDLIQEMGWEIVRQESIKDPGKRSRLWVNDDVIDMLTTNTGTEAVEGMVLNLSTLKELHFSVNVFTKMNKLRVLRFYDAQIWGSSWIGRHNDRYKSPYTECKFHLSGDFKFLSNHLRSLHWDGYPLKSLPSNFHPEKLLELKMCFSQLEQLWEGNKSFQKLKFIELSHSQHLIKTPDFSGAPKLRRIILEGCTSLVKVHPSIGALKKLIFLNLEGCKNLKSFSSSIHLESLQTITLSGCSKLKKFPEVQGAMDNLPELSLKGTAIKGLPLSIEYLNGLSLLNLEECKSLESLPGCIFKLKSLKTLILSNCSRLKKLPEIQENMESLKKLFLDDTGLRELPSSIEHLNGLVLLKLKNCKKLASLPESICKLTSLQTLTLSGCSELKKLPDDMGSLQCLVKLKANGTGIQEVPTSITLLTKLEVLSLAGCKGGESKSRNLALCLRSSPTKGLRPSFLPVLYSLRKLNLSGCNLLEGALPSDLSSLSWLECLDLSRNSFITVPNLSRLPRLKRLILEHCKSLRSLPELPSNIEKLLANDCTSLETFSNPSSAYAWRNSRHLNFQFYNCFRLVENEQSDNVEAILRGIRLVASISNFVAPHYELKWYDAVVPGSSIPEWFTDQSLGCSVTVELPPHWCTTRLMGLAVCFVFHPNIGMGKFGRSEYFSMNESGGFSLHNTASTHFSKADHIWFGYRPLYGEVFSPSIDHLKVSFAGSNRAGEVVKKCGARLVFEQDEPCGREEEMNHVHEDWLEVPFYIPSWLVVVEACRSSLQT